MTYHTNHWGIDKSVWENKDFDGKVMVYFDKNITQTDILNDNKNLKIENPDWKNLILENVKTFSEENFECFLENYEKKLKEKLKVEELDKTSKDYIEMLENIKEASNIKSITLKKEVIEWLNKNIEDKKNTNIETPINKRKGWAIGNLDYNSKDTYSFRICFYRQIDALKFIRNFSIFKEPIFYFDYFNNMERRNMDLNKMFFILNKYLRNNRLGELTLDVAELIGKEQGNTNLDPLTFKLKTWEREDEYDDIELTKKELKQAVLSLYSINNKVVKDISYENNNLISYDKYLEFN